MTNDETKNTCHMIHNILHVIITIYTWQWIPNKLHQKLTPDIWPLTTDTWLWHLTNDIRHMEPDKCHKWHPTYGTGQILFYSILFISDIVKVTWYQTGFGTHIMAQLQIYLSLLALAASHTYCSNSTHLKVHHSPLGPLLIKMSHYKTSAWLPGRLVFSLFSSSFLLPMVISSSTPSGWLSSRRLE